MRVASCILALALHLVVGLAFLGISFAPKIHVDLNSKVYDVVLVNLPPEKKLAEPVKSTPAVEKNEPVQQPERVKKADTVKKVGAVKKPVAKPEKVAKKQAKLLKPRLRAAPKKKISPKKLKPKARPKADVKKQQDDRAELQKALGSVSKILRDKEKADEKKLARELAALRESVRPDTGGASTTLLEIYSAQARALIQQNWRWPGFKDMALEARVVVTLSPEGKVLTRKLSKSSGRADFDSSVLRAVDDTRDLPVPPANVRVLELNFNSNETLK